MSNSSSRKAIVMQLVSSPKKKRVLKFVAFFNNENEAVGALMKTFRDYQCSYEEIGDFSSRFNVVYKGKNLSFVIETQTKGEMTLSI